MSTPLFVFHWEDKSLNDFVLRKLSFTTQDNIYHRLFMDETNTT
jgi:hypothetical protein